MLSLVHDSAHSTEESRKRQMFDALYRKLRRYPYNIAYKMLHNAADAEEVAQEAWLRAWVHFDRYDPMRSYEAWLYRITHFLCLDCLRHTRRHFTYSLETLCAEERAEDTPHHEIADERANPDHWQASLEFQETFQNALATLPKQQRAAIRLLCEDEITYQQMSEILHCPVGTVRSRLHRARQNMQEALTTAA